MFIHVKHKFGKQGFSKVDTVMKFKMMYSFLNSDLDIIEKDFRRGGSDRFGTVKTSLSSFTSGWGKRIRPIFVLLAAKFGNYDIHTIKKCGGSS